MVLCILDSSITAKNKKCYYFSDFKKLNETWKF